MTMLEKIMEQVETLKVRHSSPDQNSSREDRKQQVINQEDDFQSVDSDRN